MYGDVVLGAEAATRTTRSVRGASTSARRERGVTASTPSSTADRPQGAGRASSRRIVQERTGSAFPEDPWEQLWGADRRGLRLVDERPRAIVYRKLNNIPDEWGTAVNVQAMVFGNIGRRLGHRRRVHPRPGHRRERFYGEFLINAQGEDVVAGIRTPQPIAKLQATTMPEGLRPARDSIRRRSRSTTATCRTSSSPSRTARSTCCRRRNGKRTGNAAVRIAVEMVKEKLITTEEAVLRVEPEQLNQLLRPIFDRAERKKPSSVVADTGLNAGPGAATGPRSSSTPRTPIADGGAGRAGDPRPRRDLARRHRRHGRRRRASSRRAAA